jgi:hypothetical protein
MDVRIEIIGGMAGKAVARDGRPLPFPVALMALGAIGERVHAREREARSAMNLERLHVVPSPGRMATAASTAEAGLMRIAVTVFAIACDLAFAAMALVAGRRLVSSGERETSSRVIEALSSLCTGHLPARRGVTVPAIDSFGDRVVTASLGPSGLLLGILGHGNASEPHQDGDAEPDDHRASHRLPFLRACGLP